MHSSKLLHLCSASLLLLALNADATVINGINYKKFTGAGTTCPDGSKVFVYNKAKYCKAYRANISWSIPTTRTNGSALTIAELKSYEVYWTRTSDNARGTIKVGSNTASTTTFDVYTPSTYYFAVAAIDTNGMKSPLSQMVQTNLGK